MFRKIFSRKKGNRVFELIYNDISKGGVMKKIGQVFSLVFVGTVLISSISQAGLIDYNRRNKRLGIVSQKPAVVEKKVEEIKKLKLPLRHEVSTRIDKIYDIDGDGYLQKEEMVEFLTDVISSVKRRGRYSVSSNLLKPFDKNKDGRITRSELKEMEELVDSL